MSKLVETTIRFIERPSLAVLGDKLSHKFGVAIRVARTAEGLEFTIEGELDPGDREKLDDLMEKWGFIAE